MELCFPILKLIIFILINESNCSSEQQQKTWAILIAGWSSWPYYALEATIYKTYALLRNGNIPPERIIVFSPDEIAFHPNNPYPGTVFYAEDEINQYSENVYENVNVDYGRSNNTVSNFLAVLTGNKTAVKTGSGRVLDADPDDTVLISYVGMGGKSAIYFSSDREVLYADEFIPLLEDLRADKKFGKMLLLIDAYNSGSLFDGYLLRNGGILAATSGGRSGSLLNFKNKNEQLGTFTATLFNYVWIRYLQLVDTGEHDEFADTVFDLYHYIRTAGEYRYNLYGHLELARDKLQTYYGRGRKRELDDADNSIEITKVVREKSIKSKTKTDQKIMQTIETDIYKRRKIDRLINFICEDSIRGTLIQLDEVLNDDFILPFRKFPCYRNVTASFQSECRFEQDEYIIEKQHYKFARLCALNVPEMKVTGAIKNRCGN